jgi:hypothetical protein
MMHNTTSIVRSPEPIVPPASKQIDSDLGGICETSIIEIDGKRFVKKTDSHGLHALKNEWFAYELAAALGFRFVPPTYFCRDDDFNFFTLQRFVSNADMWNSTPYAKRGKVNQNKLANILLFDYLISNSDRHGANFMVSNASEPFCIDHHLLHNTWQHWPHACYMNYVNHSYTLNEFAFRLSRAKLTSLLETLDDTERNAFNNRASRIITQAWRPLSAARPVLEHWV